MYVIFCTKSASKCRKNRPIFSTLSALLLSFFSGFRGPRRPNGTSGTHRPGFPCRTLRTHGTHRADRTDQPRPDFRPRPRPGTGFGAGARSRFRLRFRSGRQTGIRRTRRGTRRSTELVKAAALIAFHRASFLRGMRDEGFRGRKARNSLYAGRGWRVRRAIPLSFEILVCVAFLALALSSHPQGRLFLAKK